MRKGSQADDDASAWAGGRSEALAPPHVWQNVDGGQTRPDPTSGCCRDPKPDQCVWRGSQSRLDHTSVF